ncbi:MAG: metal-sulfur cluster assembly factor [Infirmifilum sp.]|jgi:metal-sulfur cluster biosynthetic enzyme|uniref:Aromatic ring hydroxylase n=1 Tax=Infirmifilum uzonense TaxID=1550241 RepID=A0A0F7CL49_9CREN|nr:iron-sulfur cluster assembly protein [Infirmifilum uzonense]AKG38791.1 aromatic ring hydroxylase [Infirmifilum uzonense]
MSTITKEAVIEALKEVYDPEIPFNVVDLGLIYGVEIEGKKVKIRMTLTAVGCPLSYFLVEMVKDVVKEKVPGIEEVEVDLVFDPPWTPDRMNPEVRKLLGL